MQLNVLNDLAKANRRGTEKKDKGEKWDQEDKDSAFQDFMELARVRKGKNESKGKEPLLPVPETTSHSANLHSRQEPPEVAEQNLRI